MAAENPKGSQDGYADSIESALNLFNRLPPEDARAASVAAWIDSETKVLWAYQRPDGIIEAWHGDGNFARTTIMYCLWKTQGISAHPWRDDLRLGAVRSGDGVAVSISADRPWSGTLVFDRARHAENLRLPADWPRINQFPEWFTAAAGTTYRVQAAPAEGAASTRDVSGADLVRGLPLDVQPGKPTQFTVKRLDGR
jgi:hypothetical protein